MSYAHEIFGIKENRNQLWMQDLLLAGVTSSTFNSDRMLEIAASPFVKENGIAGYYLLLWCSYNNVKLSNIFQIGQKVTVKNSDYGTADNYILVEIDTATAYFASEKYVAYMPAIDPSATYYDGVITNTVIQSWLKAETPNWFAGITPSASGLGALVAEYGYAHGIPVELKEILQRNTVQPKFFYPVISDEPYFLYNSWYKLGVKNAFGYTAMHIIRMLDPSYYTDPKLKIGQMFHTIIIPTASTQNNVKPLFAPCWLENDVPCMVGSLENVNDMKVKNLETNEAVTMLASSFPQLNHTVPQIARFAVEF